MSELQAQVGEKRARVATLEEEAAASAHAKQLLDADVQARCAASLTCSPSSFGGMTIEWLWCSAGHALWCLLGFAAARLITLLAQARNEFGVRATLVGSAVR